MSKKGNTQKCVIITQSRYAEKLSGFFRRNGYATEVLQDAEQFQLVAREDPAPSVVLTDGVSLGPENLGIIWELKARNPETDVFVIAKHGRIPEFRKAAQEGIIEFITGSRPPLSYLWSIIRRREQKKEDNAFQNLPREDLRVVARAVSPGAEKFVFALPDEQLVEAVALDLWYRQPRCVICVSVQIGCKIGCKFCATGQIKLSRNLTTREILGQIWKVLGKSTIGQAVLNGKKPFHITYMGEGETMMNYEAVVEATRTLRDVFGERVSFTISTVGLLSGMRKLLGEGFGPWVTLQISLHAPNESLRAKLIPASGNRLEEVIALARRYAEQTKQKVCANYVLIQGQNDRREHAEQLATLLDPKYFYVKLSRLCSFKGSPFKPSSRRVRSKFRQALERHGYTVKYFVSRGQDIGSGCGQMIGDTRT